MNISPADFQRLFENFIKNLQTTEKPLVVPSQIEDKQQIDEMKIVKPLRKKKQPKRKLSDISPSGVSLNFVSIPDLVYSDDLTIALKKYFKLFPANRDEICEKLQITTNTYYKKIREGTFSILELKILENFRKQHQKKK